MEAFQADAFQRAGAFDANELILINSTHISPAAVENTTTQLALPFGLVIEDFIAGRISDDTNPVPSISPFVGSYTELEFCLLIQSPAVLSDVYEFRLTNNGDATNFDYIAVPELTIGPLLLSQGSPYYTE